MNIDTPRVDANVACLQMCGEAYGRDAMTGQARQLERELTAMTTDRDAWRLAHDLQVVQASEMARAMIDICPRAPYANDNCVDCPYLRDKDCPARVHLASTGDEKAWVCE